MNRLFLAVGVALAISACSSTPPEVEEAPPPQATPQAAPRQVVVPPPTSICAWLTASLANEDSDYAALRGPRLDRGVWEINQAIDSFRQCEIESLDGPGLTPSSNCYGARGLSDLNGELLRLRAQVNQCIDTQLARNPQREWRRGDDTPTGLVTTDLWQDMKSWPRSVIVLKIEEGPDPLRPIPRPHLQVKKTRGASRF